MSTTEVAEPLTFGEQKAGVHYEERRAAYVVIVAAGQVAMVKGAAHNRPHAFLPGGGCRTDETPEATVAREVEEELARRVLRLHKLGAAVQYFYSDSDDRYYKMPAVFFTGEFAEESCGAGGEHELCWLPLSEGAAACFHDCHAWAIRCVASAGPVNR